MRVSRLSWLALSTVMSSRPCWLMLPAHTVSPGPLSAGVLSPVMGAWLMLLKPSVMVPSSGICSPGSTRTMACSGTASSAVLA